MWLFFKSMYVDIKHWKWGLDRVFFETISEVFRDMFTDYLPESNLWAVTSYFEFIED